MSEWREISLADLVVAGFADVRTGPFGTQLRAADYTPRGVPVVNVRNLGYGTIRPAEIERVAPDVQERLSGHLLSEGDVVFGRKGAVDRHLLVTQRESGWMQGSDCIRLRLLPGSPISPEFLSKALLTAGHKAWMEAQCSHGATMASLNQEIIGRISLAAPQPATQQRIAAVLSAFDELIEINERRIELLGDLARSLYREWFVRFRFPGHEDVDLVGSELGPIPVGWEVRDFASAGDYLNGFAFKPSHHERDGIPIVKIKELKQGVTSATPRYGGTDLPPRYLIEPGDLLFSWSADLGVYIWAEHGALNQHLFKVTPSADLTRAFLFHALDEALPRFRARAQGTTMKHIKRSALTEVSLAVPEARLLSGFSAVVQPMHAEVVALKQWAASLAATRDLVLPRLITGWLDISDIDLGDLLAAEA